MILWRILPSFDQEIFVLGKFLRRYRHKKWLRDPFPEAWLDILASNIAHYPALNEDEAAHLRDFIQIFVAEKSWEGCGGLEMNDRIRVAVAAQAGLLVLGLPHQFFRNVRSILVYPTTIVTPDRPLGAFEVPGEARRSGIPILGEARLHGPVLLVWDAVKLNARHPDRGHDVVYHEFAHKLDMLDGAVDGTPPLASRQAIARWTEVCGSEYKDLRASLRLNKKSFLNAYAATNEAEFFAVATEQFFNMPSAMLKAEPELYSVLRDFYQQDTAARESR